jgi:hypothetical protein
MLLRGAIMVTMPLLIAPQFLWLDRFTHEYGLIGASLFRICTGAALLYQFLINCFQRHYLCRLNVAGML